MRVLVCGGRDFTDSSKLIAELNKLKISTIIAGEAKGADLMAKSYALSKGIDYEGYPADWNTYGNSAGPIRNKQMLTEGKPDIVVAFPGGKGTKNMVKQSNDYGVEVYEVNV